MKIAKGLMPFLLIILAVICLTGCSHVDKTDVQAVITNELDLLKIWTLIRPRNMYPTKNFSRRYQRDQTLK